MYGGPPPGPGWGGPEFGGPGPEWGPGPPPMGGFGPGPGDVEYVQEQRPGSKLANALPMCCLGILLFPVTLFVLGWNEKNYVCTHKNILHGQKMAEVIGCEPRQNWYPDMVVYMSCDIHPESLQVFTPASFGANGLQDGISFRAASGKQKAEMYQCVESSRTETTNNGDKVRVYSYEMQWLSHHVDSSQFSFNGQAQHARQQGCPYFGQMGNPPWPHDVPPSSSENYAQQIAAGPLSIGHSLIKGNAYSSGLQPTQRVNLQPFAARFRPFNQLPQFPQPNGFQSVTTQNTAITPDGMYIVTCPHTGGNAIGCMRISYFQSAARAVSVLSAVQGGYTRPIQVPSSWGCSADQFEALDGEKMSLQTFAAHLEEANSTSTWMVRVLGLLFCAVTIYCCFSPISAAADVVGDYLRCIPCVGPTLEDLLEGMVDALLCAVSCAIGCSCGLLVIAITWLVMRPLVGSGLLAVCLVLFCCGYAIARQNKAQREAAKGIEMNRFSDDSDEE